MENYLSAIYDYEFFILDDTKEKRVFEDRWPKPHIKNSNESASHKSPLALCPQSAKLVLTIDNNHSAFLKMLPALLDRYSILESSIKDFYSYALGNDYRIEDASEKIRKVDNLLKKMHPYFEYADRRINYIIDNLLQYYRSMIDTRFTYFLYQKASEYQAVMDLSNSIYNRKNFAPKVHSEESSEIKEEDPLPAYIEKRKNLFCEKEEKLSFQLFAPIYGLLGNRFSEKTLKDICKRLYTENIASRLLEGLQTNIKMYTYQNIQNHNNSRKIMPKLYKLSNMISDYVLNACEIVSAYQGVTPTQSYALFLTNNYFLVNQVENLSIHLSPYCIAEQCRDFIEEKRRNENQPILIYPSDDYFEPATDNIYSRFKDSLDKKEGEKNALVEELNKTYPKDLQLYINSIRIDFQDFEQMIVLEFLDILKENKTIKKCPSCGAYFITKSQKTKYCTSHRASHTSHQNHYKERQKESFPYYDIYMRYYHCFKQRINRQKIPDNHIDHFNRWNDEVKKINSHYSELNIADEDAYISKLNELSEEHHFALPRSYNKSK